MTARIWDAASGKPIGEPFMLRTAPLASRIFRIDNLSASFSPDGKQIVAATADGTAQIWDAVTGKPIGEPLEGHGDVVWSAAFSPDGKRNLTVSADTFARILDAAGGKKGGWGLDAGPEHDVEDVIFSPDKKLVLTGSNAGAWIWDAASGQQIGEFQVHDGGVRSAAFSPDGRRVVTTSSGNTALIWEIVPDPQALVTRAKADVPHCLTQEQRKAFFLPPEPPTWCIEMAKWPYDTPAWKQWLADKRAGKNPPLP